MPEGDTVHRAAARLHAALAGHRLVETDLRVPRLATTDLTGATVDEVVARGKHLLMRLRTADARWTLHSHLKMEGTWVVLPAGAPVRGPAHEVRAVLRTEDATAVGRLLGTLDLLRTEDEPSVVGHLGPDLLDPGFDADEAVRRLSADPERPVVDALLDQRAVAGLGNELVAELLFLRGLHPWRPVGAVDLPATLTVARRLIAANATRAVRSSTGDLRPGRTSYVYGRAGRPCRRCGTPVRHVSADTRRRRAGSGSTLVVPPGGDPLLRGVWWCPACQPEHPEKPDARPTRPTA